MLGDSCELPIWGTKVNYEIPQVNDPTGKLWRGGDQREVLCVVLFSAIVVGTTSGSVGVGVLLMLWGYQDHTQWY